jgi:hypothetical protein
MLGANGPPRPRPRTKYPKVTRRRRPHDMPETAEGLTPFASRTMSRPPRRPWRHGVCCRASPPRGQGSPRYPAAALIPLAVTIASAKECAAGARDNKAATRSVTTCSPPVHSPGEQPPPTPKVSRRGGGEPAPGLEPGTARLQDRCYPPHPAPTSDYGYTAAPPCA